MRSETRIESTNNLRAAPCLSATTVRQVSPRRPRARKETMNDPLKQRADGLRNRTIRVSYNYCGIAERRAR